MIVYCVKCTKYFDDEFRFTDCPHDTFLANDGQNNFKHYSESWLNEYAPKRGFADPVFCSGGMSEHDKYLEWKDNNKVKENE